MRIRPLVHASRPARTGYPADVPAEPSPVLLGPPLPPLLTTAHGYAIRGARKPYLSATNWTAALTRHGQAIARISSRDSIIDVSFTHAQDEVDFLNVLEQLATPGEHTVSVETAAMELMMITLAESEPDLLISRSTDGRWLATLHPTNLPSDVPQALLLTLSEQGATQVYAPGQGWRDLQISPDVLQATAPLRLIDACQQALDLYGVTPGDHVDFINQQLDAMFELGGISRAFMGYEELSELDSGAACVLTVTHLLAALGTTLPGTSQKRLGKRAETVLEGLVETLYPGLQPTLTELAHPPQDTCPHEDLLCAMSTLQLVAASPR